MKKFGIIIALALILCLGLTACKKEQPPKETKTVKISTVEELQGIKDYLGDRYSLYTFELQNNIDLSSTEWQPIGYDNTNSFRGSFDGKGFTISNMSIKGASGTTYEKSVPYVYAGLFGYTYGATIKDVKLSDFEISFYAEHEYTHVGGLIGYAYGANKVSDVEVDGAIAMGTSFYYRQRLVLLEETCDQNQYIGGVIGYSSGSLEFKQSSAEVNIQNLIAALGPEYDSQTDTVNSDTKVVAYDLATPAYYPSQAFVGGLIGLAKGDGTVLSQLDCTAQIPLVCAKSAYLGGMFGAVYMTRIVDSEFSGNIGSRVYTKGVVGGIAGLVDGSTLIGASTSAAEIIISATKTEYQSYAAGGIAGYANDFSTIQNSEVADTKILSNLANKQEGGIERSYPVIGGIVGTVRDSDVLDSKAAGGVFKGKQGNNYIPVDANYEYSAGLVADLYGNSNIERCQSSFSAYYGAIASAADNLYVEGHGRRILRFIKKDMPKVYVGVDAYEKDGKLAVDIIDDNGEIIASYEYAEFSGDGIEQYTQNYFDEETGRLIDPNGIIMVIGGITFDGYESLTGKYSFSDLEYTEASAIKIGEQDTAFGEGWRLLVALS
ncbi:MAG: hypothetical protein PHC84_00610 [Clostridia bacterium]|nr:hypothetical protein [Clostridia bacterium]